MPGEEASYAVAVLQELFPQFSIYNFLRDHALLSLFNTVASAIWAAGRDALRNNNVHANAVWSDHRTDDYIHYFLAGTKTDVIAPNQWTLNHVLASRAVDIIYDLTQSVFSALRITGFRTLADFIGTESSVGGHLEGGGTTTDPTKVDTVTPGTKKIRRMRHHSE